MLDTETPEGLSDEAELGMARPAGSVELSTSTAVYLITQRGSLPTNWGLGGGFACIGPGAPDAILKFLCVQVSFFASRLWG